MVVEYTNQSMKAIEESWRIFVDETNSSRALTLEQFDEVFGMLVQDTEPHFMLLEQLVDGKTVVNGFEVLIGICLSLKIDLKRKLFFIFRMYVNEKHENFIETNLKLVIYRDFINSMSRMLRLKESPSIEITNALEIVLRNTEENKPYVTLKEAMEYSLTHPYVCSFFEELQVLFTGLVSLDKSVNFFQIPVIHHTIHSNDPTKEALHDPYLLWGTKIRDIGRQTLYEEEIFHLPDDIHCFIALKEMQLRKKSFALVYEKNRITKSGDKSYLGIVDFETFARCLLLTFPSIEVQCKTTGSYMINVAKLSDPELVKMEPQIAEAGRKFASMTLKSVLKLTNDSNDNAGSKLELRLAYGDDFLFNLIHRFTTNEFFIPVVHCPKHPTPLLGVLTPFDIVRFMLEDLSILNGKEHWHVSKLNFLYKPLAMHRATASMFEVFHLMRAKHMSGLLLLNDHDEGYSSFSWDDILELVESWPSKLNFVSTVHYPVNLPSAITPTVSLPHFSNLVFPIIHVIKNKPPPSILPTNSVGMALTTFFQLRITRLYVIDENNTYIGVLRLIDFLRLLLEEQRYIHDTDPSH